MIRNLICTAMLLLLGVCASGASLSAQTSAPTTTPPLSRFWLAAGVGSAAPDGGLVQQWEGGIGYGLFTVEYQDSKNDVYAGPTRHQQLILGGIQLPVRDLVVAVAGGVGNALKCERSGEATPCTDTRLRDFHVPVLKASADFELLPFVGLFLSTTQPLRRGIAFSTYVVGVEIGKLR